MKRVAIREAVVFLSLLLFGVLLLPMAVYFVGQTVFGAYGGSGYGEFFGSLATKLISLEWVAWFLVLSPYLAIQTVRLTWRGWRSSANL